MKVKLLFLLAALCVHAQVMAQNGRITFNNSGTSLVSNALTGALVVAGDTFRVGLYAAPDGTSDESLFALATYTNFFAPGRFIGGERKIPFLQEGYYVMLQVRVWETAYGNSYEEALTASAMNGRPALAGKSVILRGLLTAPPQPPYSLTQLGLNPIVLTTQPVPSFSSTTSWFRKGPMERNKRSLRSRWRHPRRIQQRSTSPRSMARHWPVRIMSPRTAL